MPDFWLNSGFHLLERDSNGELRITHDFLRAYVNRPEMRPVPESNAAEVELHARLLEDPTRRVAPSEVAAVEDPDAIENYEVLLAFRDRLLAAGTVERAYLGCFRPPREEDPGGAPVPSLFLDQLAEVILRGLLEGTAYPLRARAAELLFREQRASLHEGHILLADSELVELHAANGGLGSLGRLLVEAETAPRSLELDILTEENAELYWTRDERHDTALNLDFASPGLDAFCRVLEAWVQHFLAVEVSIHPVREIRDERWAWHCGLDAEASGLLNDLYQGREVEEARLHRLLSLFRLEFAEPQVTLPAVRGRPVYLALAMSEKSLVRVKPQNLLVNLPLARPA